jgi:hypothetical protein
MGNTISNQFYKNCQNLNFQNIIDINGSVNCATNLRGQDSNSASPSDLLLFDFPNAPPLGPANYNGEPIYGGFQKIFISNIDELYANYQTLLFNGNDTREETHALYYEYHIYMEKIKKLLDNNINPHYIKTLGGVRDTSIHNLFKFVSDKSAGLTVPQLKTNFTDNLIKMVQRLDNRESLTKNTISSFNSPSSPYYYRGHNYVDIYRSVLPNVRYGFILTELVNIIDVSNLITFNTLAVGDSIFFKDFMKVLLDTLRRGTDVDKETVKRLLYMFLFQIVSACYALSLSGVNHNDLHSGNIIVKKINPQKYEYIIDGQKFTIYTDYTVMIYDFDRAICEDYDNTLNRSVHIPINLVNTINEKKDIIKVFHSLYHKLTSLSPIHRDMLDTEILQVLTPSGQILDTLRNYFNRYPRNTHIEGRITIGDAGDFDSINNILQKIYTRLDTSNIALINSNPVLQTNIYICSRTTFRNFNLINNTNLEILKNRYITECDESKITLNQTINQLTLDNTNLQTQVDTERQTLQNQVDTERQALQNERQTLQNQVDTERQALQNERQTLQNQYQEERQTLLNQVNAERQTLQNQFQMLQQQRSILDKEQQKLKQEIKECKEEQSRLLLKIEQEKKNSQNEQKYIEEENTLKEENKILNARYKELSQNIERIEAASQQWRNDYNTIAKSNEELLKQIEQLQRENHTINSNYEIDKFFIEQTKYELIREKEKSDSIFKDYIKIKEQYDEISTRHTQLQEELNTCLETRTRYEKQIKDLSDTKEECDTNLKELTRQYNIRDTRVQELINMNRSLNATIEKLRKEIKK